MLVLLYLLLHSLSLLSIVRNLSFCFRWPLLSSFSRWPLVLLLPFLDPGSQNYAAAHPACFPSTQCVGALGTSCSPFWSHYVTAGLFLMLCASIHLAIAQARVYWAHAQCRSTAGPDDVIHSALSDWLITGGTYTLIRAVFSVPSGYIHCCVSVVAAGVYEDLPSKGYCTPQPFNGCFYR